MQIRKWTVMVAAALVFGLALASFAQAQSPAELGKAIADNYLETLKKLNELMKDKPDAKDLAPKVDALKEETIKKMVELGKKVAALDDAGKKMANAQVSLSYSSIPGDVFKAFSEGQQFYIKKDAKLGNTIKDFNIITQYAFYDLLKKQAPKEAERLGIK
jgi:hypothetical protein